MRCVKCSIMSFIIASLRSTHKKNAFGRQPEAFFARAAIFFVTKREF